VQSVLYKASKPQEIVSLVTVIQNVGCIAERGEWMTESKAEEMHSVQQVKKICEVLCLRPMLGL